MNTMPMTTIERRKEQQEQKHAGKQRAFGMPLRNSGKLGWYHMCDGCDRLYS